MDVRQLHYFVCIFEERSLTAAARRLNVVQPTLSLQLANLEEGLNQKLFTRSPQGVTPTAAAELLYAKTVPILRALAEARESIITLPSRAVGHVNVGVVASVNGLLSETLAAYAKRYPDVSITILEGYSSGFIDLVSANAIDFAVVNDPWAKTTLNRVPVLQERFVLFRSTSLQDDRRPVPFARLADMNLVLPSPRNGLRATLDIHAAYYQLRLKPKIEIDSLLHIGQLVAVSELATVLPPMAVHQLLRQGLLTTSAVTEPVVERQLVAITHPSQPLSAAAAELLRVMVSDISTANEAVKALVHV